MAEPKVGMKYSSYFELGKSYEKKSATAQIGAYERQQGICPHCNNHFELEQMEGDHITPWHLGGKTNETNCQMLCKDCNRRKSGK